MNPNCFCITITFLLLLSASSYRLGFCGEEEEEEEGFLRMATSKPVLGGVKDCKEFQNSLEIESLARFAVQEHNKNQNALLEFARVLKAKEQVVAGTMYHLTLEAIDAGKKKIYEAKIWVKPWMNFKQLQEFKYAQEAPSFTRSDLGVKRDGHGLGWQEVPTHDPVVLDAADHAVKTIQQRSNSLFPYQLLQILLAKAEVIEDFVKFDLLLRLKRGSTEEKLKVEIARHTEGTFYLNHMVQV